MNDGRPRLLYLGHNLPYPPHEGALIRSYHTLRILSQAYDVSALLFFRKSAHATQSSRDSALATLSRFARVAAFPIEQEFSTVRLVWDHVRSLLTSTPYTRWAHESRGARTQLAEWLREARFDIVHVDSIDLLAYLRDLPPIPTVLAHHNVESALLRRRADVERGWKRWYIRYQATLVERAERTWCARAHLDVAVSAEDAAQIERIAPGCEILIIPNGVDTEALRPSLREPSDDLLFIGGYSWFPNADAMEHFAADILPIIRAHRPETRVRWIGKAPPAVISRFAHIGVDMLGYVDDIGPYAAEASCLVVPLRVGGGTRLKILDAWALGKAVVSTSIGCEGLDARDGENILVADEPAAFAEASLRVLSDAGLRRRLETEGRKTAVQFYDWNNLGDLMLRRYAALRSAGSPRS